MESPGAPGAVHCSTAMAEHMWAQCRGAERSCCCGRETEAWTSRGEAASSRGEATFWLARAQAAESGALQHACPFAVAAFAAAEGRRRLRRGSVP